MGLLIVAERQADDVDVVAARAPRTMVAPQPHPMSSNVMPGCSPSLPRDEVDLGDLRLFERHVVALEVGAAIGPRRVEEEREELVGQVIVRLYVLEMRFQTGGVTSMVGQ